MKTAITVAATVMTIELYRFLMMLVVVMTLTYPDRLIVSGSVNGLLRIALLVFIEETATHRIGPIDMQTTKPSVK